MKGRIALMSILLFAMYGSVGAQSATEDVRFSVVDVTIDSGGEKLAAYQVQVEDAAGKATIVSLEGGEAKAFRSPPYYDPAAVSQSRVIIAAFSTDSDLPRGRTRVARLHVMVPAGAEPDFKATVHTAATTDGIVIEPVVSCEMGG